MSTIKIKGSFILLNNQEEAFDETSSTISSIGIAIQFEIREGFTRSSLLLVDYISFCHHIFSSANFSTSISSITMRLSLFFVSFVQLLLVAASQTSSPAVPCAPLIDYIEPDSRRNLDIFLGGGAIPDDGPIFFDIPSLQLLLPAFPISPQVKLCIENITIPTSVGGSGKLLTMNAYEPLEFCALTFLFTFILLHTTLTFRLR